MSDTPKNIAGILSTQLENIVTGIIQFVRDFGVVLWYVFCRPFQAAWILLYSPDQLFPKCRPIPALFVAIFLFSSTAIASLRPKATVFDLFADLGQEFVWGFSITHALWSTIPSVLVVAFSADIASRMIPPRHRARFKDSIYYLIAAQTAAFFLVLITAFILLAVLGPQLSPPHLQILWRCIRWALVALTLYIMTIPWITYIGLGVELLPHRRTTGETRLPELFAIGLLAFGAFIAVQELPNLISILRWHPAMTSATTAPSATTSSSRP